MENKPNRIIFHHSADSSKGHQADKINAWHKKREFPISSLGFYGGYHYLIEKDGSMFQYRKENEIGAHDAGENVNSLGICLAGNFDVEMPTTPQELAFADLLDRLVRTYALPLSRLEPHRWGDTTSCPGRFLADNYARNVYARYKLGIIKRAALAILAKIQNL